jgi:hypothetical protein
MKNIPYHTMYSLEEINTCILHAYAWSSLKSKLEYYVSCTSRRQMDKIRDSFIKECISEYHIDPENEAKVRSVFDMMDEGLQMLSEEGNPYAERRLDPDLRINVQYRVTEDSDIDTFMGECMVYLRHAYERNVVPVQQQIRRLNRIYSIKEENERLSKQHKEKIDEIMGMQQMWFRFKIRDCFYMPYYIRPQKMSYESCYFENDMGGGRDVHYIAHEDLSMNNVTKYFKVGTDGNRLSQNLCNLLVLKSGYQGSPEIHFKKV